MIFNFQKNRSNVGTNESMNNNNEEMTRHLRRENELLLHRVNSLLAHGKLRILMALITCTFGLCTE